MKEILTRRFRRGAKEGNLPDLLLVDGGRGQLQIAQTVLADLKLDGIELAAIAKKRSSEEGEETQEAREHDRIYLPDQKNPILVKPRHPELLLLSKLRDEAHRTAITFHKKVRERQKLQSVLEQIPGIGAQRRKALLQHLGSVKRIREASLEELCQVPNISQNAAQTILDFFASKESIPRHASRSVQNTTLPK